MNKSTVMIIGLVSILAMPFRGVLGLLKGDINRSVYGSVLKEYLIEGEPIGIGHTLLMMVAGI